MKKLFKNIYITFSFVISKIIKKVILIDIKYHFILTYFYINFIIIIKQKLQINIYICIIDLVMIAIFFLFAKSYFKNLFYNIKQNTKY